MLFEVASFQRLPPRVKTQRAGTFRTRTIRHLYHGYAEITRGGTLGDAPAWPRAMASRSYPTGSNVGPRVRPGRVGLLRWRSHQFRVVAWPIVPPAQRATMTPRRWPPRGHRDSGINPPGRRTQASRATNRNGRESRLGACRNRPR